MTTLRSLGLATSAILAGLAVTTVARAADFYAAATPLSSAYGLRRPRRTGRASTSAASRRRVPGPRPRQACDLTNPGDCIRGVSRGQNSASATVGGTLGFNYQLGTFVAGVEADYSWIGLRTKNGLDTAGDNLGTAQLPIYVNGTGVIRNSIDSFGTVRGRVGYLVNPAFMIYGTGGLAFADTRQSAAYAET